MVQAHVFFSGTVQGVGFRYTCRSYAEKIGITGWVKNLADGRVELMAEGSQSDIDRLIQSLGQHFDGFIREKKIDAHKIIESSYADFRIVF